MNFLDAGAGGLGKLAARMVLEDQRASIFSAHAALAGNINLTARLLMASTEFFMEYGAASRPIPLFPL
ncbi:MAG: hypothetical protein H0W99_18235 [Acidobacteria bacterium]|nr:hypothetical protein [Acidobacteriota bacterium]